jgi:hypothetical protein
VLQEDAGPRREKLQNPTILALQSVLNNCPTCTPPIRRPDVTILRPWDRHIDSVHITLVRFPGRFFGSLYFSVESHTHAPFLVPPSVVLSVHSFFLSEITFAQVLEGFISETEQLSGQRCQRRAGWETAIRARDENLWNGLVMGCLWRYILL